MPLNPLESKATPLIEASALIGVRAHLEWKHRGIGNGDALAVQLCGSGTRPCCHIGCMELRHVYASRFHVAKVVQRAEGV